MQIAVVGTGIIGMDHLAAIADLEDFTLCAVCDINEEKARQVAVQYGVPYCTDYEKIARIAEPDAVILNLPHFLHAPAAEYFLNCGVHVLVEKPMANTAAECDKMIAAAKSHRKVLAVGHIQRFYLVNQAVKQAADSKKLGRLLMMNERRSIRYFTENRPKWFFDRQRAGGGIIMNYGVHAIDKMFYLAGITDAAVSAAYGNAPGYEVEGHAQLFFHTPDGFSAAVSFNGYTPSGYDVLYSFEKGTLRVSGTRVTGYTPDGKETVLLDGEDQKHMHRQLIEFKKLTEGKPSEMPTAEYGRSVMRLIDKIYCGRE